MVCYTLANVITCLFGLINHIGEVLPLTIAKELLEKHLNLVLNIQMVKNVKFLSVISPVERPQISYLFEKITVDDAAKTCQAQVLVLSDETPMAKLSFTCKQQ